MSPVSVSQEQSQLATRGDHTQHHRSTRDGLSRPGGRLDQLSGTTGQYEASRLGCGTLASRRLRCWEQDEYTVDDDQDSQPCSPEGRPLPPTIEVFHIDCPLTLYKATSAKKLLEMLGHRPRVFVLAVEDLATLDARGIRMINLLQDRCRRSGTILMIGGARVAIYAILARSGLLDELGPQNVFPRLREALTHARMRASVSG